MHALRDAAFCRANPVAILQSGIAEWKRMLADMLIFASSMLHVDYACGQMGD